MRHENVLALTIRIGMCAFLSSNENEIYLVFVIIVRPCYTLSNKIYNNNSNILTDVPDAFKNVFSKQGSCTLVAPLGSDNPG